MSHETRSPAVRTRATIRDVAALAGVGIKTVSRVINDEANVSPQTRARVERAVSALNFKPNATAGSLRRGDRRTRTLGLLLDAVDNPFSAAVNRGVEIVATTRGTAVFAASSADDADQERALVDAFARRRIDGLILMSILSDHGFLHSERELGMPIVFIDRPPLGLLADAVLTDNRESARRATEQLIANGHRRIAHLGDELVIATAQERRRGYADAMGAHGLAELHADNLSSPDQAEAAVRALLAGDDPPTAIFSAQNLITIGTLHALYALGREHDVALISFDDVPVAELLDPGLTAVAQDPIGIGSAAAAIIFRRIDGDTSPATTILVPTRMIRRGSGEIPGPAV